jgi:hypothetical protein
MEDTICTPIPKMVFNPYNDALAFWKNLANQPNFPKELLPELEACKEKDLRDLKRATKHLQLKIKHHKKLKSDLSTKKSISIASLRSSLQQRLST